MKFDSLPPPVPSAPPSSIRISGKTSSSITVQWGLVDCIHQNGDITGYLVRYGVQGSGNTQTMNASEGATAEAIISDLKSAVSYSIEVAAVNSVGIGVYRSPLMVLTLAPHICASELEVPLYPGSKIVYNWTQTETGSLERQTCPNTCQDLISYPTGAVLERECRQKESRAVWQAVDLTGCDTNNVALRLCEMLKV